MSPTALEDQAEIGLRRDLQPDPIWSNVGESLLKRLARQRPHVGVAFGVMTVVV